MRGSDAITDRRAAIPADGDSPRQVRFRSHALALDSLEEESRPVSVSDWSWRDSRGKAEAHREARRARVARRAGRLLASYERLQREATAMALMHAARTTRAQVGTMTALGYLGGWLRKNTIGASGLDLPGTQTAAPGAFMRALAEADGGYVTGRTWGTLVLPERHQDVMARERLARGQVKRPRLTGDIDDAPKDLRSAEIRRLIKQRRRCGGANALRVLVLFAGAGGATEGWRHVQDAKVVAAVEIRDDAAAVYAANHDHPIIVSDINDWVRVSQQLAPYGPFDLVQWSPPCQPHSRSNANKRVGDKRAAVMMSAARLIHRLEAPHWIMENVCGVLQSPVWQRTLSFLRGHGYDSRDLEVNANHCGVPQTRRRLFVVGSKTAGTRALDAVASNAEAWAASGPDTRVVADQFGGQRRPTVRDIVRGVKDSFWMRSRSAVGACVRASDEPVSTVLTTCTGKPKSVRRRRRGRKVSQARRYAHARRDDDVADVNDASILSVPEWGLLQGFPFTYRWHAGEAITSRTKAGVYIGNAVPPLVMRTVGRWVIGAGFEPGEWDKDIHGHVSTDTSGTVSADRPTIPRRVAKTQTQVIRGLLLMQRIGPEAGTVFAKWGRAQLAASTTVVDGKKVLPHWALKTPRYLQSPLLEGWRTRRRAAGAAAQSAVQERADGLGDRGGPPDMRPFLCEDPGLTARVWARILRGEAYTGLTRPITGRPNRFWREWERSGATGDVLRALRDGGYMFDFTGDVEPSGLGEPDGGGNGSGVHDPEYASWLHRTIEELVVLGVIEEVKHRPYIMNKL